MSSREIRELKTMVDILISLSRETLDQCDRYCNIMETLLGMDNEAETEKMLERFR